jgi:hypothetical protein
LKSCLLRSPLAPSRGHSRVLDSGRLAYSVALQNHESRSAMRNYLTDLILHPCLGGNDLPPSRYDAALECGARTACGGPSATLDAKNCSLTISRSQTTLHWGNGEVCALTWGRGDAHPCCWLACADCDARSVRGGVGHRSSAMCAIRLLAYPANELPVSLAG